MIYQTFETLLSLVSLVLRKRLSVHRNQPIQVSVLGLDYFPHFGFSRFSRLQPQHPMTVIVLLSLQLVVDDLARKLVRRRSSIRGLRATQGGKKQTGC